MMTLARIEHPQISPISTHRDCKGNRVKTDVTVKVGNGFVTSKLQYARSTLKLSSHPTNLYILYSSFTIVILELFM